MPTPIIINQYIPVEPNNEQTSKYICHHTPATDRAREAADKGGGMGPKTRNISLRHSTHEPGVIWSYVEFQVLKVFESSDLKKR
jgi:hypothetical protein